jgi:hypothetical protein
MSYGFPEAGHPFGLFEEWVRANHVFSVYRQYTAAGLGLFN